MVQMVDGFAGMELDLYLHNRFDIGWVQFLISEMGASAEDHQQSGDRVRRSQARPSRAGPESFAALPRSFYEPSAKAVARQLLGHWLLRNTPLGPCGGEIVETEAYLRGDPACHGYPGPTRRNQALFGAPGHGYVYLIYGFHFCVNAVCRPAGVAEAVLIRALEPSFGQEFLLRQRPVEKLRELTSGPGKLCQAMSIDRSLDGIDICDVHSTLFIAENPQVKAFRRRQGPVITTTRIGITQAAALPLRFYLEGSQFVSRRAAGQQMPAPEKRTGEFRR